MSIRPTIRPLPADPGLTPSPGLAGTGWQLGGHASSWPNDVFEVAPQNWQTILKAATISRRTADEQAASADARWRTAIREALLAGLEPRTVADIVGVTVQRVYQIRDRRR